jgi:hypothetical protein
MEQQMAEHDRSKAGRSSGRRRHGEYPLLVDIIASNSTRRSELVRDGWEPPMAHR